MDWTRGQCCVFHTWVVVGYNIAIGLYVLDMWSVLCVPCGWLDIIYIDTTVRTGHLVSVVCFVSWC